MLLWLCLRFNMIVHISQRSTVDVDRQVDHRIYRLIRVAVNFWGGEGWVTACHHCRVVPDDEDAQSLEIPQHNPRSNLAKKAVLVVPVVIIDGDLKHLMNISDIPASNCEKLFAGVMLPLTKRNSNSILVPKSWSQLVSFLSILGNSDNEVGKKIRRRCKTSATDSPVPQQ